MSSALSRVALLSLGAVFLHAAAVDAQDEPSVGAAPAPLVVTVLTNGRIPEEIVAAAQTALIAQLTPMAGGRPVQALATGNERIAACRDDACIGAELAQAGAAHAVILRLTARARRPFEAVLELRDATSGVLRREPIRAELPTDPAALPDALASASEGLREALPAPPPPPATLLVTVNVDDASVRVDGEEIGTSPVAPVEVTEGSHEVLVQMQGYLDMRRRVEIRAGEQARIDVTLSPLTAVSTSGAAPPSVVGGTDDEALTGQWWFWAAIGGGAALLLGLAIGIGVAAGQSGPPSGIMLPRITGAP